MGAWLSCWGSCAWHMLLMVRILGGLKGGCWCRDCCAVVCCGVEIAVDVECGTGSFRELMWGVFVGVDGVECGLLVGWLVWVWGLGLVIEMCVGGGGVALCFLDELV